MGTRNVVIMFTDIKGFTARVSDGSRRDLRRLRSVHERLLVPVFRHFRGRIIKTIGDAFLVVFARPTDAVLCGVTIQEVLRQHNASLPKEEQIQIRVAINTGEAEISDGDVLGEPVNLAARLESVAEPGEVYFTEAVYLTMNRKEAPSTEIGEHTFKGIPYPIRVYKVLQEKDGALAQRLKNAVSLTNEGPKIHGLFQESSHKKTVRFAVAGLILVAVVVLSVWYMLPDPFEKAVKGAKNALASNAPLQALQILDKELTKTPENMNLAALANQAAKAYLNSKDENLLPEDRLNWLRKELEKKPYLEPLRPMIPMLDAKAEVAVYLRKIPKSPWPPMEALANRYPNNKEVPLYAATMLTGKVYHPVPLRLYKIAIDRGAAPSQELRDFCYKLLEKNPPGGYADPPQDMLKAYFREESLAWAQNTFDTTYLGVLVLNAWTILKDAKDPRTIDPFSMALYKAMQGYADEKEADASLALFLKQKDPERQKQLIALHKWVLSDDKKVSWFLRHSELVARNLKKLEEGF